jgi:hypothetical protein
MRDASRSAACIDEHGFQSEEQARQLEVARFSALPAQRTQSAAILL